MAKSMAGDQRRTLSFGKKVVFGVLAPLVMAVAALWLMLVATNGEGPSVGGRGMVLLLVLLPAGLVAAGVLNLGLLFVPLPSRRRAFVLGAIAPAIGLALAFAYLWRIGPFQR